MGGRRSVGCRSWQRARRREGRPELHCSWSQLQSPRSYWEPRMPIPEPVLLLRPLLLLLLLLRKISLTPGCLHGKLLL